MRSLQAMFPQRWTKTAIGGLLLAFVAAGVGTSLVYPNAAYGVARQAEKLADLLDARSPGKRQVGELTKLKARLLESASPLPPEERALGKVFPPRARSDGLPDLPETLAIPLFDSTAGAPLSLPLFLPETVPATGGGSAFLPSEPGAGGFILPPAGQTAVNPPPPTSLPGEPEVPAVPEPSTWAIMIIGFAMCAAAMRRRKASAWAPQGPQ